MSQIPSAAGLLERVRFELHHSGYSVVRGFLTNTQIAALAAIAEKCRASEGRETFGRDLYSGQVSELSDLPDLAEMLTWPEPFDLFRALGFADPRWFMAFLIQKPPASAGLYWHQDWWGWSHPASYLPDPPLVFAMFYLVDTRKENGCLRVLPGSHLTQKPLHAACALNDYIRFDGANPSVFAQQEGEVDVEVQAGDLVLRDVRLLHATHANGSGAWRPLLGLSVAPNFALLPAAIQRTMELKRPKLECRWEASLWKRVESRMCIGPTSGEMLPIVRKPSFRGLNRPGN